MNSKMHQTRYSAPACRSGSALVLTLLVVSLLMVLAVSFAAYVRMELRAVSQRAQRMQAQSMARLGLELALADLQQAAGVDQRVTAPASQLDGDPGSLTLEGVVQPFWTGSWESGSLPLDERAGGGPTQRERSFQSMNPLPSRQEIVQSARWLVSAPQGTVDPRTFVSAVDPSHYATLSGPACARSGVSAAPSADASTAAVLAVGLGDPGYVVTAPLQTVTDSAGGEGRYAYWVSDEGVKANVRLRDPAFETSPSDFVRHQLHHLTAQANDLRAVTGLNPGQPVPDFRNPGYDDFLDKLNGLGELVFQPDLTLDTAGATRLGADLTVHSAGVLANVREGGLREDLTAAFETPAAYEDFVDTKVDPVLDAPGVAKVYRRSVPSLFGRSYAENELVFTQLWQNFYNYYCLYKARYRSPNLSGGGTLSSLSGIGDPDSTAPTVQARLHAYPHRGGVGDYSGSATYGDKYLPVFLGVSLQVWLSSEKVTNHTAPVPPATTVVNTYRLRVHVEPRLVLYNPYNVHLEAPRDPDNPSQFLVLSFPAGVVQPQQLQMKVAVDGVVVRDDHYMLNGRSTPQGLPNFFDTLQTSSTEGWSLAPGEVRVFSMRTDEQDDGSNLFRSIVVSAEGEGRHLWKYMSEGQQVHNRDTGVWEGEVPDTAAVVVSTDGFELQRNNGRIQVVNRDPWPVAGGSPGKENVGRLGYDNEQRVAAASRNLGSIASLQTSGAPSRLIAVYTARVKGLRQQTLTDPDQLLIRPLFAGLSPFLTPFPSTLHNDHFDNELEVLPESTPGSGYELLITPAPPFRSFWGNHNTGKDGGDPTHLALFDVPRQPLLSLGQLMHASNQNHAYDEWFELQNIPTDMMLPVGGSLASPYVDLDALVSTRGVRSYHDKKYLLNEALFDQYFFSTVPPSDPDASWEAAWGEWFSGGNALTEASIQAGDYVLPNARMRVRTDKPVDLDALRDTRKAAGELMVQGAFNVNATSVAAWKALLRGLSGNQASVLEGNRFVGGLLAFPFYRLNSPVAVGFTGLGSAPSYEDPVNHPWGGVRSLTEDQMDALAEALVTEIKRRGPFLSVADFINRRLLPGNHASSALAHKGAVQAAIEATDINDHVVGGSLRVQPTALAADEENILPEVAPYTAVGIPGWLMQQDVIQALAPVLTARSDTFVIRTCGESGDARVWLEAVVQRVPDYLDAEDPALAASGLQAATPPSEVNAVNQRFGRAYRIQSVRWLNREDL